MQQIIYSNNYVHIVLGFPSLYKCISPSYAQTPNHLQNTHKTLCIKIKLSGPAAISLVIWHTHSK